jgi:hypothetical protein
VRALPFLLAIIGAGATTSADDAPQLPPAQVALRIDAPDPVGPWKMVVTNKGDVPVRFAADGRLLTFEVPKPEDPYAPSTKKKQKAPPPVVCKLPAELRPTGVVEDRAVVLAPGARYEEVISPALYCFGQALAKALVPGATVTAKLGFTPRPARGARKNAPPTPPFIVEPAVANPTVSAVKELTSEPFVLPAAVPVTGAAAGDTRSSDDPNGPRIELTAPGRVDTANELTVGMNLTVKNAGGRPTLLNLRRDNLMFDVDGPSGSAHCGQPAERRGVPKEGFTSLAAGSSRTLDVWVGEMCSDVVFDRPGLYRVWPSLAFPNSSAPSTIKVWTETVSTKEPVLVRVHEGRLPFYNSPPQVFGASR